MKAICILIIANALVLYAHADGICSNDGSSLSTAQCATAGAGVVAAVGSGIYSAKKYSQANSIEKQFTQTVFQNSNPSATTDASTINRTTQTFRDGDRITFHYQLSDVNNRNHHIQLMMDNASSARSSAATFGALALTAERTVTSTDANGNVTTTVEPDFAMRASYALMATHSLAEASDYDAKARDARAGGPVPTYNFEKVVDANTETAKLSSSFTEDQVSRGSKILRIDRLPVEKFALMKTAIWKARGGLVGVALGAGLASEEVVEGVVADKISNPNTYTPRMSEYEPDHGGSH